MSKKHIMKPVPDWFKEKMPTDPSPALEKKHLVVDEVTAVVYDLETAKQALRAARNRWIELEIELQVLLTHNSHEKVLYKDVRDVLPEVKEAFLSHEPPDGDWYSCRSFIDHGWLCMDIVLRHTFAVEGKTITCNGGKLALPARIKKRKQADGALRFTIIWETIVHDRERYTEGARRLADVDSEYFTDPLRDGWGNHPFEALSRAVNAGFRKVTKNLDRINQVQGNITSINARIDRLSKYVLQLSCQE